MAATDTATDRLTSDRPRGGLTALCIAVTTSWGLLYYSLPVALAPIAADTGWSHTAITGAFSAGLIVSALAGVRVGRILDTRGPRRVMTAEGIALVAAPTETPRITEAPAPAPRSAL
ncbi:hypothetical protein [Micrococcus terreus]|uniref:Major Facilitator Superfamily protein n=1 Tax=Micrococcus terreus TaxID=574650 RepID=A0A1I7MLI4_9MICC|nr:hypothetical protein [Micrococcus terreus]SFV22790.1 hypothetical protein SAMN04487966_10513 [Micrococcus terreus]